MSLWQWNAERGETALLNHDVLHWKHDADRDPAKLDPPGDELRVRQALRFHHSAVDQSVAWATGLGWYIVRRPDVCLLAPTPPPLPLDQFKLTELYDDISEVFANAENAGNSAAWQCQICFDGLQEDHDLVSAHEAFHPRTEASHPGTEKQILHVFHKRCLETWKNQYGSGCPMCKKTLHIKPMEAQWVIGNTRVSARMDTNPFIVNVRDM